ncbi:hypothetical protein SAE02_73760 [Skermanella aerolata]|uniref:Uncharacterized protein n=1 Tax=Skermanella aerolata TaxID=393310 RepID=A0A512E3E0_9PROT|nr:hypothetical protein [Skermanella aerolata]KJB90612.1 hypothetical protein N826_38585 [Skermanella aerolata KACC 11604]GEO43228.1 hypothetical protein SAE02_73760 [Skermanella aerolata]
MTRRVELIEAGVTAGRTTYRVLAGGERVGTATELTTNQDTPWRLTLPGHCANLRRSSRETVLATVTWLLDPSSRRTVVYVPANPGSRWDEVAAELRAAGFEVMPTPMPESSHVIQAPVILCTREV